MAGAFGELAARYRDRWREAKATKAKGAQIVGLIGPVPVEPVIAASAFPLQITADYGGDTPAADLYMDDVISPEIHALFEAAHRGDLEGLDLLILTRPYDKLYYYLKEVSRIGQGGAFPPVHMFDLMQSQRDAVAIYNRGQFGALIARLERLTGVSITDDALQAAIVRTDAVRILQRRLLDQRAQGLWTGVDAMQALGAAAFMPLDAYSQTLQTALDEQAAATPIAGRPRLLVVSSESLTSLTLHRMLEDAGSLVVAEDDLWGARAADDLGPAGGDIRETLLQRAWRGVPTSAVYPPNARQAWFQQRAIAPDIDAVVFHVPPSDHLFGWDYPAMAAFLDQHDVPHLLIRQDAADPDAKTAAAAFFAGLQVSA